MCIDAPKVQTAKRNIPVYKVVIKGKRSGLYNIWYSFNGLSKAEENDYALISQIHHYKARGFDSPGYGYSCFDNIAEAKKYQQSAKLAGTGRYEFNYLDKTWYPLRTSICKLLIPIGTRYAAGKIAQSFVGEGLRAIRAERLVPLAEDKQPKRSP